MYQSHIKQNKANCPRCLVDYFAFHKAGETLHHLHKGCTDQDTVSKDEERVILVTSELQPGKQVIILVNVKNTVDSQYCFSYLSKKKKHPKTEKLIPKHPGMPD